MVKVTPGYYFGNFCVWQYRSADIKKGLLKSKEDHFIRKWSFPEGKLIVRLVISICLPSP